MQAAAEKTGYTGTRICFQAHRMERKDLDVLGHWPECKLIPSLPSLLAWWSHSFTLPWLAGTQKLNVWMNEYYPEDWDHLISCFCFMPAWETIYFLSCLSQTSPKKLIAYVPLWSRYQKLKEWQLTTYKYHKERSFGFIGSDARVQEYLERINMVSVDAIELFFWWMTCWEKSILIGTEKEG